jgi:hypothetical protein
MSLALTTTHENSYFRRSIGWFFETNFLHLGVLRHASTRTERSDRGIGTSCLESSEMWDLATPASYVQTGSCTTSTLCCTLRPLLWVYSMRHTDGDLYGMHDQG